MISSEAFDPRRISRPDPKLQTYYLIVALACGLPKSLVVDHGPEFMAQALDRWAYEHGVALEFIRPGKPVENAYIESFHSRFRDECLAAHWCLESRRCPVPDRAVPPGLQRGTAALESRELDPKEVYTSPHDQERTANHETPSLTLCLTPLREKTTMILALARAFRQRYDC